MREDSKANKGSADGLSRREFLSVMAAAALAAAGPQLGIAAATLPAEPATTPFKDGWLIQSSAEIHDPGAAISTTNYSPQNWYSVSVPSTVLAGLVANGEYPDIFVGDNLSKVPTRRFASSWWYRKEFTVDGGPQVSGPQVWLYFKGINYRANIWLNGKQIAVADRVVGTYRDFEFNVTDAISAGGKNVLAVEVFPPDMRKDLAITFVDWAPGPPDRNMGIWQDVLLRTSGAVAIRNPFVDVDLDVPSLTSAKLTVMADLVNPTDDPITGVLSGKVGDIQFSQNVSLNVHEAKAVSFDPITLVRPRVWWPWHLGSQEFYELELTFKINDQVSDQTTSRFGIRKATSRLQNGHRLFSINGVDLLVLGGGYAPDLFQRRAGQENHIIYAKDMNLNTIRLEGKLEDHAFFDLCDEHGVMVMAGWCCCSPWEKWKNWKDEQHLIARESLRYQIRRARTHPSILCWLNGSDNHPPADVERDYLAIEAELKFPCPTLSCASKATTEVSGPTGVKMEGPYQWEPPIFWMTDKKTGGAYGFNTEVGPGPVPPPLESLQKMLPPEHRWPIDKVWDFHCGKGAFSNIDIFFQALEARFGKCQGLADFSWKSQAQAYETIRAMYEAFRRNKFDATGEIQWMLNNAWPSLIWHLYDYYLRPGAAYFATKLGCEPVHLLYSYDNHSIVLANDTNAPINGFTASATIYDINAKPLHQNISPCAAMANSSAVLFTLPEMKDLSTTYFLRLALKDANQKTIGMNSYWLSTKPDVMGENGNDNDWNMTPVVSYADYIALEKLPPAKLTIAGRASGGSHVTSTNLTVTNESDVIAMMVRLKLTRGPGGEEILPIWWEDNYFMLLPRESRDISASYFSNITMGVEPEIVVECYNNNRVG
jgi:exo-1,4-beta-D-glucosaminidase